MKAIILGGGIAGLTLAARLKQQGGWDITIYERNELTRAKGHAFLIHPSAAALINVMPGVESPLQNGMTIQEYNLLDTQENCIVSEKLENWLCMRRTDLLQYLLSILKDVNIVYNQQFSHFIENETGYQSAVFTNGEQADADVFFGCDGVHSSVRKQLFGDVQFSPVHVKELVGVVQSEKFAQQYAGKFTKFVHPSKAIAVGFIPCNNHELVWYMQFDATLQIEELDSAENLANHAFRLAADFPPCVTEILKLNSFDSSYVWHSTDFDLLPAFHKKNVVLMGDAAHVALPFTSAGVANALADSGIIATVLQRHNNNFEAAFSQYYHTRSEELSNHIKQGRMLQTEFLNHNQIKKMIPLIQVLKSTNTI
jgi:FAD-dependent urate hydroxylase